VLDLVTRQRELNFMPGDEFSYCGTGYLLLALIVERVSDCSFADFCHERIFQPLGMASTHVHDNAFRIVPNRAYAYYPAGENGYENAILTSSLVGGTGLFTTVEDLARWDENFYSGRVGDASAIGQMLQRGRLNNGEEIDYAFGLIWGSHRGREVVLHGGDGAGIHSYLIRFPREHFSVAVLGNYGALNARHLARQVADIYLGVPAADAQLVPGAAASASPSQTQGPQRNRPGDGQVGGVVPAPGDLAAYCGRYHSVELGVTWTITLDEDRLRVERRRQGRSELVPAGTDRFKDGWAGEIIHGTTQHTMAFDRDGQDAVCGFGLSDGSLTMRNVRFVKL